MFRKAMTVFALLLAVGLVQATPQTYSVPATTGGWALGGPSLSGVNLAQPGAPGVALAQSPAGGGGIDAGYILQPLAPTIYGYVGYGSYTMGFCFRPVLTGQISKLGRNRGSYTEQSTIKVWDSTANTVIATANVTGTNWSYTDITPVTVTAGKAYFVTTYGGSYVGYGYVPTIPVNSNDITVMNGAYNTGGDMMPTTNAGTMMYGLPDFYFTSVPGTETWTGNVSTDWNVNGNWDGNNVPGAGIIAIIPAGRPNYPTTNSGAGYGCKSLSIAASASMTVVASKPLVVDSGIVNAGTLTGNANINCVTLSNSTGGSMTVASGAILTCAGNITNAGTLTNNGTINCPVNFTNTGDFSSGTGSSFYFKGPAAATASTGVNAGDATCSFFDLYVAKDPIDVMFGGGDPTVGGGTWFGGTVYTYILNAVSASAAGSLTRWQIWDWYSASQARIKVFRANYGGYQYGLVGQGPIQTMTASNSMKTFNDTITGVQTGDLVGCYYPYMVWGSGSSFYYAAGDMGSYTGWNSYTPGTPRVRAYLSGPAGDVTSRGDFDINGKLQINVGSTLVNGGATDAAGAYTVAGNWINNGTYTKGAAAVTFDGTTTISGTALANFNAVNISGALTAPATNMTVTGNWNCTGTFNHGNGRVLFSGASIGMAGQSFYRLTVNNTTDGNVTVTSNIGVADSLKLTSGTLLLGDKTLTLGTAGAAGKAVVYGPAGFSVVGTSPTGTGKVLAAAAGFPYSFEVLTGANIAAKYAQFTGMGTNGVVVNSGATVNVTNNFSQSTFDHGTAASGPMLKIENGQTIDDITNLSFIGTAGYNIEQLGVTGHITVTAGAGSRWGEDFDNDPNNLVDWRGGDIGPTAILAPMGGYDTSAVIAPKVKVKNFTTLAALGARIVFRIDSTAGNTVYADTLTKDIDASAESTFTFDVWPALNIPRTYASFCSTYVAGDTKPSNDVIRGTFVLSSAPPGWYPKNPMPAGAKPIKNGGWLAYDAGKARIYSSRGNKQPDFWAYAPAGDSWGLRAPWQPGVEGKLPYNGSAGCADGNGVVYATKGNNKSGFWKYDANANAWTQKKDVPLGVSNKKVKGGTDITWAYKGSVGSPYLLKGYKNEFYRYDTGADSWQVLTPAPVGASQKWDKGSWVAYDDVNKKIYAFKAKYHELYRYSPDGDSWSAALSPMPIPGSMGSKKAKEGSCGTFIGGSIYALKGGNTREFWKYTIATNAWAEKETIPTGLLKKKVKAGADIVTAGLSLYATKGNKSNELWQYVPGAFVFEAPRHDGVLAGKTVIAQGMSISPNPLAGGYAVLRYGLPKAGAAQLSVYNVAGQTVMARTLAAGRSGIVNLDLRHLSNGVYLVKFASDGYENSQKLVVQR
jgi:hypothetical protein